jgi:hypothetical protein
MKKTSHRTSKSVKNAKPVTYDAKMFEEKFDIFTFKKIPISNGFIENLAEESVRSALTDKDDFILMGFFYERGHNRTDIHRWCNRNEKFKNLYEARRKIIAAKREAGALLVDPVKKYHRLKDSLVRFTMPFYEEEWRDREKEIAKDRLEEQAIEQKVIVIERFPETK